MMKIDEAVRVLKEMRIQANRDLKHPQSPSHQLKLVGFQQGLNEAVRAVEKIARRGRA